ncbi:lef-5 [Matsumuraeses phaseoli granulovirus]|uniref:Lef-5 n=1 Tax=Matsumuraeses phaseoli granulovirus TaxID=2760664 RepID=A0AAE7MLF5_9BBAC|nr:lef-5 [Matsumuraeses phaseoli granulovirus]QOD40041.1 lef-5 [Matsumuraeses phaseoli granulovirus]
MSFDQRPSVVQNVPSVLHLFKVFSNFRQNNDYEGLVNYLITNYPQNVKNRTFNFNNTGHIFHMLYAYVPSPSNKERKQIRLDCIEKLLKNTTNDFKLYEDLIDLMNATDSTYRCPCELITARLNDNIAYNESLKTKNFDIKPCKLKKEPIDTILFKYSINWKHSLNKRNVGANVNGKKINNVRRQEIDTFVDIAIDMKNVKLPSTLSPINGYTVQQCHHEYVVEERQLRAGDEAVSFVKFCKLCGCN